MWQDVDISTNRPKEEMVKEIRLRLKELEFEVIDEDVVRPWGGYWRIVERQGEKFLEFFYRGLELPEWTLKLSFSPKILLVAPNKRLSWQYHDRRGEVWKVMNGKVGVYLSETDEQPETPVVYYEGQLVDVPFSYRHRLAGLECWGLVAEIWVHTDADHPSDEADNYRLADDFGRR